ncbi:polysaccharide biosynthesis/export family protein [Pontibacter sp. G13]|uniref:polysaccharide biosynthesis/export family protein n=1 Tax=Pontibacter sp. G13 TaxID=3074898 RepID=UPI00288AE329|nr:polysaccharide biosynthesis/export family protein [Pontibacter sp. G13]WNJ19769.1 polysaccharide biosynthesis/export family protein [Pontibacter sp. G13]
MVYLQDVDDANMAPATINEAALRQPYKIRPYDNLTIKVNVNEESTIDFLNQNLSSVSSGESDLFFKGYTVDDSGNVDLPLLGSINVQGLTTEQIKDSLDAKYADHYNQVTTTVKLSNFRVTMLGEFMQPGVHYVFEEKLTLLQAVGMAGGMTEFANATRVKILRETESGKIKKAYLNLGSTDVLESEYFFLRPNDVVYIEPYKAKGFQVNAATLSLALTAVSLVTVMANLAVTLMNTNNNNQPE